MLVGRRRLRTIIWIVPLLTCLTLRCAGPDAKTPVTPSVEIVTVDVREGTELVAALSPDGSRVAFILLGQVWMVGRSGGPAVPLTDVVNEPDQAWFIAWAPDSRRLAVWSWKAGLAKQRVLDVDSREASLVSERADVVHPVWSPDGTSITFSVLSGESAGLWSLSPDGSGEAARLASPERTAGTPAYSADGRYLAYAGPVSVSQWTPTWQSDLWEIDLMTGDERQLTADSELDGYPAYSPDGRWLAFLSDRSGTRQVWILERDSGEPRSLTPDAEDVYLGNLSWLPDSTGIVYAAAGKIRTAYMDGTPGDTIEFAVDLQVARWTGLRRPELPTPGERRRARGIVTPELSPDGQRIAFAALGDLWIVDVEGGAPQRLTQTAEDELQPRWSPDASHLAYVAVKRTMDWDLRLLEVDRPEATRTLALPPFPQFVDPQFAWSPDGRGLAYLTGQGVGWLDLESGETRSIADLTGTPSFASLIGWTPSGNAIVFATATLEDRRIRRNIWRAPLTGSEVEEWLIPGEYAQRAAWTPNLSRAAYADSGVGYVVALGDSAEPTPVPDPSPRFFSWSSDGTRLLYLSGDRVRLLDVASGSARTLEIALEYSVPLSPPSLIVRNARIIDGTGTETSAPADVLVSDSRIQAIEPAGTIPPSEGTREIDAEGGALLPGLFNLHAHYHTLRPPSAAYLYYGVLATRDVGMSVEWMQSQRERVDAGEVLGPRVFMSGGLVVAEYGLNSMNQRAVEVADVESVTREIATMAAFGVDVIKPYYNNAILDARVSVAAHAHALPMTSHHVTLGALESGLEGKEHSSLYYRGWTAIYRDDLLSTLRAADACVTPTLIYYVINRLAGRSRVLPLDDTYFDDPEFATMFPSTVLEQARQLLRRPIPERRLERWTQFLQWDLENVRRLHDAGIRIATGTDLPSPAEELGVHLEMELLVKAGLTPLEAIRAATFDAASCLGVERDLGSIEIGKFADFIIVDGDPATDIRDTRRIEWVVLGGKLYSRQEILDSFSQR